MTLKDKELEKRRKIAEKAHKEAMKEGFRLRESNVEKTIEKYVKEVKEYNSIFNLYHNERPIRMIARAVELLHKISFKVKLNKVKEINLQSFKEAIRMNDKASLVSVRPCAEGYEGKTFIGILLGDFALGSSANIDSKSIIIEFDHYNPAIYIPEVNKIVFGCESWWGKIKSIEDFKDITKEDIDNVWYMQLLKALEEK